MILVKKIESIVDKLTPSEQERLKVIQKVQEMLKAGFTYTDVAKETGISTRSVARYRTGNPEMLCRLQRSGRVNSLDCLKDEILELIKDGYHQLGVYRELLKKGYNIPQPTVTKYIRKLVKDYNIDICKGHRGPSHEQKEKLQSAPQTIQVKKSDIQKFLWMEQNLELNDIERLYEKYPIIFQLKQCISEFREIFYRKNMPLLYIFIANYKNSPIPSIKSFALGLEKDIDAVENAVASDLSNGFVEGNNNRIKMIKRVMYGRCGIKLLTAKIMLGRQKNG